MNEKIQEIKLKLKEVATKSLEKAFCNCEEVINKNTLLYNDLLLMKGDYYEVTKQYNENIIDYNQQSRTISKIRKSFLFLVDKLEEKKISPAENNKANLPEGNKFISALNKPSKNVEVEITINGDINDFTPVARKKLMDSIENFLELPNGVITIKRMNSGSIKITISLPEDQAQKLKEGIENGYFTETGIRAINFLGAKQEPIKPKKSKVKTPLGGRRFIQLLEVLDNSEIRQFKQFLDSPIFNNNKKIKAFFQLILKYHPNYHTSRLNQEYIFKKLFPEKAFNEKMLRQLFSRCRKMIEEFLIQIQLEQEDKNLLLQKALKKRNLNKEALNVERRILSNFSNLDYKSSKDYQKIISLLDLDNQLENLQTYGNLINTDLFLRTLEEYELISKFKIALIHLERNTILSQKVSTIIEELDNLQIIDNPNLTNPLIEIYSNLLNIYLDKPNAKILFEQTQQYLEENGQFIPKTDKKLIYRFLLNYRVQNFSKETTQEIFTLYKYGLKQNLLSDEKGLISPVAFFNIINIVLVQEQFDWANSFIQDYQDALPQENREILIKLSKATILFHQKEFEKALLLLENRDEQIIHPIYRMRVNLLEIRLLYEQFDKRENQYDFINKKIWALEKYLQRNKIFPQRISNSYMQFLQIMKKLFRLKYMNTVNLALKEKIIKDFKESSSSSYKLWLSQKLEEI